MARLWPQPDIAESVERYTGFVAAGPAAAPQREPAGTKVPLIINFGAPFRLRRAEGPPAGFDSFVAGLDPAYWIVEATGPSYCMQVDFTPLGAYRFFRLPMREIAGRAVDLRDVAGQAGARLAERLHDAPDWAARFALLDAFVRRRLASARPPSAGVEQAWRRLQASRGRIRIGALARELDWSRKHLAERFAVEIGQPPKTVARILRFARARAMMLEAPLADWADLALRAGYADQAHLMREFRQLAGVTPAALRRALLAGRAEGPPPDRGG